MVNEFIEIERKNHDADTVQNYASLYLSSNNLASLKITNDDRRYSVVNMTDIKYNSVFSTQDRENLFLVLNISNLGAFLFNRPVDLDKMSQPFTSDRTKLVKVASLSDWEDTILNSIAITQAGKKLTLIELKHILYAELDRTVNIGNKAIKELELKFPNFFIFKREFQKDGRRIFTIEFLPLDKQPRHLIENTEITE